MLEVYKGPAAEPFLHHIAQSRARMFKDFPYLWDAQELTDHIFEAYKSPEAVLVLSRADDGAIAGFVIGMPLRDAADIGIEESKCQGILTGPFNDYFYLSDILIEKRFQGQGLEAKLFKKFEAEVRGLGAYPFLSLFIIERAKEDPRRPEGFVWFEEELVIREEYFQTNYRVTIPWLTFQADGTSRDENNILNLWEKRLELSKSHEISEAVESF